jgi:predicted metal-binding membrane protein
VTSTPLRDPAARGRARLDRLREALEWRPEWPIALLVVLAWVVVLMATGPIGGHDEAVRGAGHMHHAESSAAAIPAAFGALGGWALMSVAMMVPVTLPAVRHVGVNSLRVRRTRAMAIYTAGYVAVWMGFGAAMLATLAFIPDGAVDDRLLLIGTFVVAAAWQLTPTKRRALFACRRTVSLPPLGRRADVACLRYAVLQGRRCVISCWPFMIVMAIVGHANPIWMVALTALIVAEELPLVGWRLSRPAAAALAVMALLVALVP